MSLPVPGGIERFTTVMDDALRRLAIDTFGSAWRFAVDARSRHLLLSGSCPKLVLGTRAIEVAGWVVVNIHASRPGSPVISVTGISLPGLQGHVELGTRSIDDPIVKTVATAVQTFTPMTNLIADIHAEPFKGTAMAMLGLDNHDLSTAPPGKVLAIRVTYRNGKTVAIVIDGRDPDPEKHRLLWAP